MNANTNSASPLEPPGSEPKLTWEERYQAGDTPWEKGMAAPPLREFLERWAIQGAVFVPGCGTGHDVRALASQGVSGTSIVGLDLAASAVTVARSYEPVGKETYEQGDLFSLLPEWHGRFDWVVEHTCLCAIEPSMRGEYVRAVTEVLKPGGSFFAIFYLDPDVDEGPPFGVSRDEIGQLFGRDFELVEEFIPIKAFAGREGREVCQVWKKRGGLTSS